MLKSLEVKRYSRFHAVGAARPGRSIRARLQAVTIERRGGTSASADVVHAAAESKSDPGANALAVGSALSCATGPYWGTTKGIAGGAGATGGAGRCWYCGPYRVLRAILVLPASPNKAERNPVCRESSTSHSNQADQSLHQIPGCVNRKSRP